MKKRVSIQVDPEFRSILRQDAAKMDMSIAGYSRYMARKRRECAGGGFNFKI